MKEVFIRFCLFKGF